MNKQINILQFKSIEYFSNWGIIGILVVLLIFSSCTKTEEDGLDVTVTGFIKLIDYNGLEVIDKSGANINIYGSSETKTTDSNGKFVFSGLNAGTTYKFNYSKNNYGTKNMAESGTFYGDQTSGLLNTVTLYQKPDVNFKEATVSYNNSSITIYSTIANSSYFACVAFAKDSSNVSDTNYDYSSSYYYYAGTYTNIGNSISLTGNNYPAGTTIYIALYFFNYYEDYYYWDNEFNTFRITSGNNVGIYQVTI
jgi:hypothetical protein